MFGMRYDYVRKECERLGRVWKALSEATAELERRGVDMPAGVNTSLRGARALISLGKAHDELNDLVPADIDTYEGFCVGCSDADIVARVDCELRHVEDLLAIKVAKELGSNCALELRRKTKKAWEDLEEPVFSISEL
jgi:hypothetical protein